MRNVAHTASSHLFSSAQSGGDPSSYTPSFLPPPMLLHTQEPAKAPAEYMRQRPTREIRDDDPISKGNTPSRKKKSQIRWKATPFPVCIYSSMLPLLLLSLSLCVYSVCVCTLDERQSTFLPRTGGVYTIRRGGL